MDINNIIKKVLKEATSETGSRGSYLVPLQPGVRRFKESQNGPFTIPVSKYDSPLLAHDSYDGKMNETKKQIKKIESKAKKVTNYIKKHPESTFSDEEGNPINPTPGKNKKIVPIKEDLAVWFGTKKKPKGSKQPKGPWVNICRKVDGKHPPCGRPEGGSKGYPKCRAAGVAGKMSDSQKKAACQQKRRAEKKDTQTGKGQKPVMTSYKPKNENMKPRIVNLTESDLRRIIDRVIMEQKTAPELNCDWFIMDTNYLDGKIGELHFTEKDKGFWYLQKYSIKNDPDNFIEDSIEVPQFDDIQVSWDENLDKIKLVGESLKGLDAFNKLFNTNADAYSCNLIFASDSYPSKYGISRSQYLNAANVQLVKSNQPPKLQTNEVKMKDGVVLDMDSYFVDKKLLKKTYYYLSVVTDPKFAAKFKKCDIDDSGED